ncbi:MAG: ATP-binding protein [Proteobacteria bacterium]|nr:ATP-binding protein [Pseudomonadota bacterium]
MRYLFNSIKKDLQKKMVFVGGPRQCGKTTLAKALLAETAGLYLNWDRASDQKRILGEQWHDQDRMIVLDEIHKYPKWKTLVKGYYDTSRELHQFLVTGSARLDVYRRGGDSLLGRYHYWRLHPFTLHEPVKGISPKEAYRRLLELGGFPEPFLDGDPVEARRWREERHERILRDDIRDLENIKKIQLMGLLLQLLRERVGGPVNVLNLATDLQVSPATVTHWIEIFERMYLIFVVRPYSKNLPRSLVKPFKVYFFDTGDVIGDIGARFENFVATHLLKELHFRQDSTGEQWGLHYVRDKEGNEVDFVLVRDRIAVELTEAKWSDSTPSKSLLYFGEKTGVSRISQIVGELKSSYTKNRLSVIHPLDRFKPWE